MAAGMQELGGTNLMLVYSTGFGAIYVTFAVLFSHALRRGDELGLDTVERHMTVTSIQQSMILVGLALVSVALSLCDNVPASGFVYFGLGPAMALHGFWRGAAQGRLVTARG